MYQPISGMPIQILKSDGTLASGYFLKFYESGTNTPLSMATDTTGGTLIAKCYINSSGYPINTADSTGDVFIPHLNQTYKIVLYKNSTDADNNTTANADYVVDSIPVMASSSQVGVQNLEFKQGSEALSNVFTLTQSYTLGDDNLRVYRNGILLREGSSYDYTETTTTTVTFSSSIDLRDTDTITFVIL